MLFSCWRHIGQLTVTMTILITSFIYTSCDMFMNCVKLLPRLNGWLHVYVCCVSEALAIAWYVFTWTLIWLEVFYFAISAYMLLLHNEVVRNRSDASITRHHFIQNNGDTFMVTLPIPGVELLEENKRRNIAGLCHQSVFVSLFDCYCHDESGKWFEQRFPVTFRGKRWLRSQNSLSRLIFFALTDS